MDQRILKFHQLSDSKCCKGRDETAAGFAPRSHFRSVRPRLEPRLENQRLECRPFTHHHTIQEKSRMVRRKQNRNRSLSSHEEEHECLWAEKKNERKTSCRCWFQNHRAKAHGWPDMSGGPEAYWRCSDWSVSVKYPEVSTTYSAWGEGEAPEETKDKYRKFCYMCHWKIMSQRISLIEAHLLPKCSIRYKF